MTRRVTCKKSTSRSLCHFLFTLLTCLSLVLTTLLLSAQVAGGRIYGTVIDPSGAAVPHARVTIKNIDTGVTVSLLTASDGIYQAPNLLPGRYEVTAAAEGFDALTLKDVVLTVGGEAVINPQLKVGSVSSEVQVYGQAPSVDTSSSVLNAVVTASTMRELPLNGRDWTSLATLQPGITNVATQAPNAGSGARGNRAFGNQLTVAGHRPENNNYRIDGISINDYSNSGPGSSAGLNLGVDSIAEFSVLTSNYSAEYGRTSGGVINAITRSGSNAFHGSAFEFLRNSALDARNFFDGASVPPFRRNQFGASAGGPVRKDKTFIFGAYEGIRQNQSLTTVATVPSLAARGGTLHNSNGSIRIVSVDSSLAPYFSFWPVPNGPLLGLGDTGVFRFAAPQVTDEDFWTVRGDQVFSDRDRVFATYMFDDGTLKLPDSLNNFLVGNITNRRMAALEETHMFSQSFLNSVRFGYSRSKGLVTHDLGAINPKAADLSLGTIPGRPTAVITVPGLTSFAGAGSMTDFTHIQNSFQMYDDAFANRGKHSLKLGFAFEWLQYHSFVLRQPNGTFSFGSLADLLTNNPTSLFAPDLTRSNPVNMRQNIVAGYFQDDWRLRRNLTLNLGLRYEMSTRPKESSGQLMAVRDPFSGAPQRVDSYFIKNPTQKNFEPRVGFAWDPRSNGKTAIRAGFGIYDALPLLFSYTAQAAQSAPFNVSTVQQLPPNIGAFPKKAYSLVVFNLATSMGVFVEPNPKRNYLMNWNLTIQNRIASNLTATVAYVGSRGVHDGFGVGDTNDVAPTLTPQGFLWPATGNRANPNVGALAAFLWNGSSSYHGLQTQISKSLSRGLQLQGSYTWGKCIDTESATARTFQFSNGLVSWPLAIPNSFRRGLCDFNLSHVFVFNAVWSVPSPQWGRAASALLGGWELGSILNASTGAPFSVLMGGDPLGMKNTNPIDFPMRLNGPGCDHPVNPGNVLHYIKTECFAAPNPLKLFGNAGRNILVGPSLVDLDFSLYKNIPVRPVSEAFRIQFRTEFFNILNHTNFAPPLANNTVFNQSGARVDSAGLINATQTSSRQIQFGLKLQW